MRGRSHRQAKSPSKKNRPPSAHNCGNLCRQQVHGWARRLVGNHPEAEDICQEVYLHCAFRRETFRSQAEFTSWLYRIMLNVYADHQRRKCRRNELTETEIGEETFRAAQAVQAWAQEASADSSLREQMQAALAQLPERSRQLLVWKHVEGCSHADIAQRLGRTEQSVRVSLHRAREKFKKVYKALSTEEL